MYDRVPEGRSARGVVPFAEAASAIAKALEAGAPAPRRRKQPDDPQGIVFAAMPFAPQYLDVYMVAMRHAAKSAGLELRRVDREDFTGDVVDQTHELIRNSRAVIADLSESKPNVLYELGFAHALRKPVATICSTPLERLPFNVRNWNVIEYERGQTTKLKGPLTRRLKGLL